MVVMLIDAVFQSPVASVWWPWDRSGGLVDYEEIAALAEPPNMADSGGLDGYRRVSYCFIFCRLRQELFT